MPTIQSSTTPDVFKNQMALKQADLQGKQLDIQREKIRADAANQKAALDARAQQGDADREAAQQGQELQMQQRNQEQQVQQQESQKDREFTEKMTQRTQEKKDIAEKFRRQTALIQQEGETEIFQLSHDANKEELASLQAQQLMMAKMLELRQKKHGIQEEVMGDMFKGAQERRDANMIWTQTMSGALTPMDINGAEAGLFFTTSGFGGPETDINMGTATGFQSTMPGRRGNPLGTYASQEEFQETYGSYRDQARNNWWSEVKMSNLDARDAARNVAYYATMKMGQMAPDGAPDMANMLQYVGAFQEISRLRGSEHAADRAQAATLREEMKASLEKNGDGNLIQPFARSMQSALQSKSQAAREVLMQQVTQGGLEPYEIEARQSMIAQMEKVAGEFGSWVKIAASVEGPAGGIGADLDIKEVMRTLGKGIRDIAKDRAITPAEAKDSILGKIKDPQERKAMEQFLEAYGEDLMGDITRQRDYEDELVEFSRDKDQRGLALEGAQLEVRKRQDARFRELIDR